MMNSCVRLLGISLVGGLPFTASAAERLVPSDYSTIQAAVDAAAADDVIRLASGEYREQAVVRNKRLSIVGDTGAIWHAYPDMAAGYAQKVVILDVERADLVISNLVFEGNLHGDTYPDRFLGVVYRSSSGRVENCTFRGFRGTSFFDTRALNVNNVLNSGIISVTVTGCSFSNNTLSLAFFGNDQTTSTITRFTVHSNSFNGLGANAPHSIWGLLVAPGAEGVVQGNTLADYTFYAPDDDPRVWMTAASAIVAFDTEFEAQGGFRPLRPVVYSGNTFSNNNTHLVSVAAHNAIITNNIFFGRANNSPEAALQLSGSNIIVADNNFASLSGAIQLFGKADAAYGISLGIAKNIDLLRNWFTNVTTAIQTGELVTFDEIGTERCCFAPEFQTLELSDDSKIHGRVRSWHNSSLAIESSPDLKNWSALRTNTPALPVFEFADTEPRASARFYRARNK